MCGDMVLGGDVVLEKKIAENGGQLANPFAKVDPSVLTGDECPLAEQLGGSIFDGEILHLHDGPCFGNLLPHAYGTDVLVAEGQAEHEVVARVPAQRDEIVERPHVDIEGIEEHGQVAQVSDPLPIDGQGPSDAFASRLDDVGEFAMRDGHSSLLAVGAITDGP